MTIFRPCIDLHQGKVKQLIGGSLTEHSAPANYISTRPAQYYAKLYRQHQLTGGHIISLGAGNEQQIQQALAAWPQGMQVGGGINPTNANKILNSGASHVIITSYLFNNNEFCWEKLKAMVKLVGKNRLVIDISCRYFNNNWHIAANRWQTITTTTINQSFLQKISKYCAELLVHAIDVEGLQNGIDTNLIALLSNNIAQPITYAGGAKSKQDLQLVKQLSAGSIDLTIGSSLDIFGGTGVTLQECIAWNKQQPSK